MSSIKGRLQRAAGEMAKQAPELPVVAVIQDLDDRDLYTDADGNKYRGAELASLGERCQLIIVEYTRTWPPASERRSDEPESQ